MAGSYRERKKKKGSYIYLILAAVLIIVMFKWGIQAFVNLLAGPSGPATKINQTDDNVPPQAPILSALPNATNSAAIKVEGFTEADVTVTLIDNDGEVSTTQSNMDGAFSFDAVLKDGENKIYAKAKDKAGNESQSPTKIVVFDNKPVEVKVDSPRDGGEFFGTKNQNVTLSGKVNKQNVNLNLNGSFVRVNNDGTFNTTFKLAEGDNTLTLSATDTAGNQGQAEIKLKLTL